MDFITSGLWIAGVIMSICLLFRVTSQFLWNPASLSLAGSCCIYNLERFSNKLFLDILKLLVQQ